jgi:hypothetical protein
MKQQFEELVAKYNEGLADPSEIKVIERLIEEGEIELTHLRQLTSLDEQLMKVEDPMPTMRLDDRFHTMLGEEKRKLAGSTFTFKLPQWGQAFSRLAFGTVILVVGFAVGYILRPSSNDEVRLLTQQVGEMKEMMMLTMLEKESASERLKAVSLTSDMTKVSGKVTNALFQTLNQDPNVNVRLAALEALVPYVNQSSVREELIHSISKQDSPLVQVSLAELMVALQEKKSVTELQKLMDKESTPKDVKKQLKKSIDILI